MKSAEKFQTPSFDFKGLRIWSTKLRNVEYAVTPPSNTRPNPLATDDRIYASIFAPGSICALDRKGGKLIWRRDIGKYAGASVLLYKERLFAKSANTLFALRAASGKVLWSFSPYGTDGESMYSSPTVFEDLVYIGDRKGYLHCLNAVNGATVWKRLTSRARNNDVNSTPVVMNGLVIVTTNAKTALAYNALSGKLVWKQRLDAPSTFGPLTWRYSIVAKSDSLYVIGPKGNVRFRFSWKETLEQIEATPRTFVATFWPPDLWDRWEESKKPEPSSMRLISTRSGKERTCSFDASCSSIRYSSVTGLLYMSHLSGIDLFDATRGNLLCRIKTSEDPRNGVGLVDVRERRIYALTGDGSIHALRHPKLKTT